jgi:hypothetical protein
MARKKTENAGAGANGSAGAGKPASKTEGVRRALDALGKKATPTEIDEYLRREFNIKMSLPHISTTKSNILRGKGKGKGRRGRRKKGAKAAGGAQPANAATAFDVKDMREIRALVDRVGVEKFKDLRAFREVLDVLYP